MMDSQSVLYLCYYTGHDERITTCEKFRESLLSALRPRLRQDVTTADLTPLREYLYVYDKLDKRQEFEEEYSKARPGIVHYYVFLRSCSSLIAICIFKRMIPDKIKSLWTEGNIESETASTFISWYQNYVTGVISFLVKEYAQMKVSHLYSCFYEFESRFRFTRAPSAFLITVFVWRRKGTPIALFHDKAHK